MRPPSEGSKNFRSDAWELHFPEKINVSDFDDVHHTWKVIPLLQDQTWISFQDFMHKKLLKSVNFWRSYSKNTMWTFFWDEVIFDCNGPSWRSTLSVVSITRSSAFNSRANDIGEPCKTAELIEMPFWGGLRWCEPKEPCLDGGPDPSMHVLFLSC